MDWFHRITGFKEARYGETQRRLQAREGHLYVDGVSTSYGVGELEIISLRALRERAAAIIKAPGQLQAQVVQGDARELHRWAASDGALFQVASQFNLLEMAGPDVTPEAGVTGYAHDHTQGPACAMSAGAGTLFRNYLLPLPGGTGQTARRQVDCLAPLGAALGNDHGALWTMRNGYALASVEGLRYVDALLQARSPFELDALRGLLEIGVHWNVQVTEPGADHTVTQAYCSALPVAYCAAPRQLWARFATLVLEAAYEATLLAGVLNAAATGNPLVYFTRIGGGGFGNETGWIHGAMARALEIARSWSLDVRVVSFGRPGQEMLELVAPYNGAGNGSRR